MAKSVSKNRSRCLWFPTFTLSMFWMLSVVVGTSSSHNSMRGKSITGQRQEGTVPNGVTRHIEEGAFTYYQYPSDEANPSAEMGNDASNSSLSSCRTILLLGVGAAMDSTEYSKLAMDIVTEDPSMVTIILDDNPNKIPKQDAEKFAKLVHAVASQLGNYIPACAALSSSSQPSLPDIIIGGHSASGEGAIAALPHLLSASSNLYTPSIKGFVGLAPYKIPSGIRIDIPTLFWGFSTMTCAVNVQLAADKAYQISNNSHRVLFQVQTDMEPHNPITGGPHCVFSDHGCLDMCNPPELQWIKGAVARSISVFVQAIQADGAFVESTFQKVLPAGTKLFVNKDELNLYDVKEDLDAVPTGVTNGDGVTVQ